MCGVRKVRGTLRDLGANPLKQLLLGRVSFRNLNLVTKNNASKVRPSQKREENERPNQTKNQLKVTLVNDRGVDVDKLNSLLLEEIKAEVQVLEHLNSHLGGLQIRNGQGIWKSRKKTDLVVTNGLGGDDFQQVDKIETISKIGLKVLDLSHAFLQNWTTKKD